MKLTTLEVGLVPEPLRAEFGNYPGMFSRLFGMAGVEVDLDTIHVFDGEPLPDPNDLEAVLIPGSPAGVYDPFDWMEPLREFVRAAYAARLPMVGICFGHQVIAEALGGEVRKSEKGWGIGRHTYDVTARPGFMQDAPSRLNVACSHQDQVITPPAAAQTVMASAFCPHAGLVYDNGAVVSFQPHPEFLDPYARALMELRSDRMPEPLVTEGMDSLNKPSNRLDVAAYVGRFLHVAAAG